MRRATVVLAVFSLLIGVTAAAGAANPDPFKGRWVALDVDDSIWHITIANGQYHGIDSGTLPGDGAKTRTWGEMWSVGEYEMEATINLQFLEPGPPQYWSGVGTWFLSYDQGSDTLIGDQGPFPLIQFCRVPCDPYDYPPYSP